MPHTNPFLWPVFVRAVTPISARVRLFCGAESCCGDSISGCVNALGSCCMEQSATPESHTLGTRACWWEVRMEQKCVCRCFSCSNMSLD